MTQYIFLARHGTKNNDKPIPDEDRDLSKEGKKRVEEIAAKLSDTIQQLKHCNTSQSTTPYAEHYAMSVAEIWCSKSKHSHQTAEAFSKALQSKLDATLANRNALKELKIDSLQAAFKTPDIQLSANAKVMKDKEFNVWSIADKDEKRNYKVRQVLGRIYIQPPIKPMSALNSNPYAEPSNIVKEVIDLLCKELKSLKDGDGVLVIGHQPQLGWIARQLLGRTVPIVPIANAEVICIAFSSRERLKNQGRFLWSISDESEDTQKQLRAKIQAKMETAKLLGAFIIGVLSFLLGFLLDTSKMNALDPFQKDFLDIAALLFLTAIILYGTTMLAYDTLLMPTRFWGEVRRSKPLLSKICVLSDLRDSRFLRMLRWEPVWRPPSSSYMLLYQTMQRIWFYRFMTATWAVIFGLIFLTCAVFDLTAPIKLFDISVQHRDVLNAIAHMDGPSPKDQAVSDDIAKNQSVSDRTGSITKNRKPNLQFVFGQIDGRSVTATKNMKLKLKYIFEQNDHYFSDEFLVLVESKDHKWLIVDKRDKDRDIAYIVQREGLKLQVYHPFNKSFFWDVVLSAMIPLLLFILVIILLHISRPKLGVGD